MPGTRYELPTVANKGTCGSDRDAGADGRCGKNDIMVRVAAEARDRQAHTCREMRDRLRSFSRYVAA